jgi:hypothetical protein
MAPKTKKKPTPEELLVEIQGQEAAKTYEFEDYLPVIHALQQKGHSYADIAQYIKERLGIIASRGQVYRAYQIWLAEQARAEEGIAQMEDLVPPRDFEDEIAEKVEAKALNLIQMLDEQLSGAANEPWNDPEVIIHRASAIITERYEIEKAAEAEAAAADEKTAAKKGK